MDNVGLEPVQLSFGAALKWWRKRRGFTQEQLGALVGYEQATISKWEERTVPLDDALLALVAYFSARMAGG